jgi:acetyl esterase/lipase
MKLKSCASIPFAFMVSILASAQQKDPIPLYTGAVPNSKPAPADYKEYTDNNNLVRNVVTPTLLPYFPEKGKANGAAVIICPGGGYAVLAYNHEGKDVAKRFAENGVTAFVLKYRLPSDKIMTDRSIGPLQDAQRALQLVHENAAEWGIDPDKIGIMGFSAGGHLAATATTHYNTPVIPVTDSLSIKPDFSILVYPVISMGGFTHSGSREFLIGKNASQQTVDAFSNEKQVKPDMCPAFIVHSEDDDVVPIQNAILFYQAMVDNKVKGVLDTYQSGGHGYGMNNRTTAEDWFENAIKWLKQNKMM